MSGNQHQSQDRLPALKRFVGGRSRAIVLTIAVLLVVYAALSLDILPGATTGNDLPQVMAAGGCFDIKVEPVAESPPVSLEEVEQDVRQHIAEVSEDHGWTREPGELKWAEYGEIVSGEYSNMPYPGAGNLRWVLIFEPDNTGWLSVLFQRSEPRGWNIIYAPEARAVGAMCGGPVI